LLIPFPETLLYLTVDLLLRMETAVKLFKHF
jgi:hypothetical protein